MWVRTKPRAEISGVCRGASPDEAVIFRDSFWELPGSGLIGFSTITPIAHSVLFVLLVI